MLDQLKFRSEIVIVALKFFACPCSRERPGYCHALLMALLRPRLALLGQGLPAFDPAKH